MNIDEIIEKLVELRQQGYKTVKIYDFTTEKDKDIDLIGKPKSKTYIRILPEE